MNAVFFDCDTAGVSPLGIRFIAAGGSLANLGAAGAIPALAPVRALYFVVAPRLFMPWLEPFLGAEQTERGVRARRLSLLPYLLGGGTYLLAGVLNPYGMVLVLISAAADSLGGASLLAWYPPLWARRTALAPERPALAIERSVGWLVAALLVLVVFVGVLGPGVNFVHR